MSSAAVRIMNPLRAAAAMPKLRACSASPLRFTAPFGNAGIVRHNARRGFSQSSLLQEKKYTDQHEWVELAGDGKTATIGISEYAANALGDVVFVELPEVDADIAAGDSIGAVESVKSASDINAPISGRIVEANTALDEKPKIVNTSPEKDGWFAKIEVSDKSEIDKLMDTEAYKASLEE